MGDSLPPCAIQNTNLRNRFALEKCDLSYADLHSEVVKSAVSMTASSSEHSQKQHVGSKAIEHEEIVKHMSNLPSYLERGKHFQDKALNFGVMDWGHLEKCQYNNHKQVPCKSSKYSPSSSNSSSYFSTDGSSTHSSRARSCSPARQKSHRPMLQLHLNASPKQNFTPYVKSSLRNLSKFQAFKDAPVNHWNEQKHTHKPYQPSQKTQLEIKPKECKRDDSRPRYNSDTKASLDLGNCRMASSSKGKMKIQDEESIKEPDNDTLERHKTVVLLLPRDGPESGQTNVKRSVEACHKSFSENSHFKEIYHSNHCNKQYCPLQSEVVREKNSQIEGPNSRIPTSTRIPSSPSRSKNEEEKKSTMSSKSFDLKTGTDAAGRVRNLSPLRRFSIGMSKMGRNSISGDSSATESSAVSHNSTKNNKSVSNRAHSSPLRRLLNPLFPSKATNSHQLDETSQVDSKIKVKAKLDLGSCKEVTVDELHRNEKTESSTTRALFQTAIKNGRPLFTFAVENNSDILAATMRSLTSSGKDGNSWIYTFFMVHEVKKKNGRWLSQGNSKGKSGNYVPNITAQMKVLEPPILDQCNSREFILFGVDQRQFDHQILDVRPLDELAAIVVKFPRKENMEENGLCVGSQDIFSTTVIVPGGDHGLPSKGEPSPLIERWLSGGLCDCGGWDVGCGLRILENQTQSSRRSSSMKTAAQFELLSQGEFLHERHFFNMSPLKEGIFSVEFNSPLSLLQAFSICISVLDSRKPSPLAELSSFLEEKLSEETTALKTSRANVPSQVEEEVPVKYALDPPLSPVGRV